MLRRPISMKRSIRFSSSVDLVPKRTAHRCWIKESSCSVSAMKSSSFLASAYVGLPVVGLVFIGTSMPNSVSNSANCLLEESFFRTSSSVEHASFSLSDASSSDFSSRRLSRRSSSVSSLIYNCGCVNMRNVMSISFISSRENCGCMMLNKS